MRLREIMQTNVITVGPDTSLVELDQMLMNHQISGAPVVSADGEVVGMVSKTDVVRALSEEFAQLKRPVEEVTVADIMTPGVTSAHADDGVATVAKLMLQRGIHRVLVYENGRPVGLVTSFDMLRAVAQFVPDS